MFFGDKGIVGVRIEQRDFIVVPEKRISTRVRKDIKDIPRTLYRTTVIAGVPIVAFRSRGERFPAGRSYGLA